MEPLQPFIETEQQRQMLAQIHAIGPAIRQAGEAADREGRLATENIEALLDIRYNQLTLPTTYGGLGFGIYDLILCQETLARYDGATALSIGWHVSIVGDAYEKQLWQRAQHEFLAQKIVHERALTNRAVTEKSTGSPTRGGRPEGHATVSGDGFLLNGRKTFTSLSTALTHPIVALWMEDKQAIGYFLVDATAKGVRIDETWDVMAMRGTASHDLVLEDVYVEKEALLETMTGPRGAIRQNGWIIHVPAVYLGIAQAACDYATNFAKTYQPNSLDVTISELPHIQQKIGEMNIKLMTARHFLYSTIRQFETRPETVTNELGVAKLFVTNTALEVVDLAMRIVGAQSLQQTNPLSRYYRDIRAGLHNPPMDDMTVMKVAKVAIGE